MQKFPEVISAYNDILQKIETYKTKTILRVKDETISGILAYSKSLSCVNTDSLGDVLIINN